VVKPSLDSVSSKEMASGMMDLFICCSDGYNAAVVKFGLIDRIIFGVSQTG
jgi:hypothetical protein